MEAIKSHLVVTSFELKRQNLPITFVFFSNRQVYPPNRSGRFTFATRCLDRIKLPARVFVFVSVVLLVVVMVVGIISREREKKDEAKQ